MLSRPGPQFSRSGALSWIQCKLGKQYLCKKLPSGNRTHVLVFARFPICFWSKSGWNEDRISSCTNYLQSPLTEFDQKIYSSHQVKCKYLILHQNTKDPSQYQIHNPISPQCWFMLFAMRHFLSWIHTLFGFFLLPQSQAGSAVGGWALKSEKVLFGLKQMTTGSKDQLSWCKLSVDLKGAGANWVNRWQ